MVPGPRAHIHEESDEATCKWFDEKLDSKTGRPVLHRGKRAFHLIVNNPAGFNDEMIFANILAARILANILKHTDTSSWCPYDLGRRQ